MPGPGSTRWNGIFHLHGRIADAATPHLPETDLVLTSAEFGDAYLRSGWASRYLYDLLRHSTVVIVGYSLSDPPTRYLFDALAADRKRFEFKQLYAIVSDDDDEKKITALWEGRGAVPLLYKAPKVGNTDIRDHGALRRSIEGWANYADDPTAWAKNELKSLSKRGFAQITESDWASLDWILSRADNDRLLEEANPTPRWLDVLRDRADHRHRKLEFGPWISKRLNERPMIDAVLRNQAVLTEKARVVIESELLRRAALSPTRRSFWLALCASIKDAEKVTIEAHYLLSQLMRFGDTNGYVRGLVAELFTPVPKFRYVRAFGGNRRGNKLAQLAHVEFETGDRYLQAKDVCRKWPDREIEPLLKDLISALKDHLRKRHNLLESPRASVWVVPSIKDHPQNFASNNIGQLIRLIVDLFERLAVVDADAARRASLAWQSSTDQWEVRLWLHALSLRGLHPGSLSLQYLLDASDEIFWGANFQREVMQVMINRWDDFPAARITQLEDRLVAGNER